MNLGRDLLEADFEQVEVTEKPEWYAAHRVLCEAALQADASGDPGLAALQKEATQVLVTFDVMRRVLATADPHWQHAAETEAGGIPLWCQQHYRVELPPVSRAALRADG